jgi:hypothetical protein
MSALEARMEELADEELAGVCRLALNVPVPASEVPASLATWGQDEIERLVSEVERRMALGRVRQLAPDVMGAFEAAEALGVAQTNLRTVKGLPEPIGKLKATSLWDGAAIRELASERKQSRNGSRCEP